MKTWFMVLNIFIFLSILQAVGWLSIFLLGWFNHQPATDSDLFVARKLQRLDADLAAKREQVEGLQRTPWVLAESRPVKIAVMSVHDIVAGMKAHRCQNPKSILVESLR